MRLDQVDYSKEAIIYIDLRSLTGVQSFQKQVSLFDLTKDSAFIKLIKSVVK